MKEITIYNTLKGRLETVSFEFTDENTTWFDNLEDYYIYSNSRLLLKGPISV
ncbi:conserved domain protein [delta proteobacterium NaphS2]|nr:conserved domain protein [delta proteobacterium NaphS2]